MDIASRHSILGIDLGAETIRVLVCEVSQGGFLRPSKQIQLEHSKNPAGGLREALRDVEWDNVVAAAVTGRNARLVNLPRVPVKEAQLGGLRHLIPNLASATVVSIGAHGFSVLEARGDGPAVFRENSRCSQGTGNFLRQLVERFSLSLDDAATLCEGVTNPAPLSGRCPVILKTDMTHLANKGEDRARIIAGLYDAVCENVQALVKPGLSPRDVVLVGGVARAKRVRARFAEFLGRAGMRLIETDDDVNLFIEAFGAAVFAAQEYAGASRERRVGIPLQGALFAPAATLDLQQLPPLANSLARVHRLTATAIEEKPQSHRVREHGRAEIDLLPDHLVRRERNPSSDLRVLGASVVTPLLLGFDIGSTGSKCVALDQTTGAAFWETYLDTNGDPVGAATALMRRFVETQPCEGRLAGFGVTGSGREIVGSLLATCYGPERVFILNEIAAHAEGALHFDPKVDTIFEIGGQDAKYIRLIEGRVVDAAMNEACSAGTGSFIAEQGRRFAGVRDVVHLGSIACGAESGVSLGQHCSVFMAEVIDEAIAAGAEQDAIVAGIYDSIIQNYLNRVKGPRSVGARIFCQGMPFAADALAAAVARRTGSDVVVPPNPGTVGALGIALLARKAFAEGDAKLAETDVALDAARMLGARVASKDSFNCKSTKGCGDPGNLCRIDRLRVSVAGGTERFLWGGACSLYDKGTRKKKLPDLAPDPFREREALIDAIATRVAEPRGGTPRSGTPRSGTPRSGKTIALSDEFTLKSLFPFFATFLHAAGFTLRIRRGADQKALKRGIESANVPYCAPMQQSIGVARALVDERPDFIFLPMVRSLPRVKDETTATVCPIVQASPDIFRADLGDGVATRIVRPVIDIGPGNLASANFRRSIARLARELEIQLPVWVSAYREARATQEAFDAACAAIGERALTFCREQSVTPVIILGRAYTIHNTVLNSNVPAIVREQGALPIPVDCYPVDDETPSFDRVYWGYAQRSLRAAHQIRRRRREYSVYCSNYSCGPDSFNLHFFADAMAGKPFAVIETDGHSGDAGTKTRIEAFLHCVREDERAMGSLRARQNDFTRIDRSDVAMADIKRQREILLVPRMGSNAEVLAAAYRGAGFRAEALALPDHAALELGRRHTSGKECLPMTITAGSLLARLERERDPATRFAFFMPTANGPCRFGAYNLLHKLIIERSGWSDRVRVFSPADDDYFKEVDGGFQALIWAGFVAEDLLLDAYHHARPAEVSRGAAKRVHDAFAARLRVLIENEGHGNLKIPRAIKEIATGRLFGVAALIAEAATAFAATYDKARALPTVQVVGEIYVRCDPFANGFVVDKLLERGVRVRFAPFSEWIEYTRWVGHKKRREGISRDKRPAPVAHLTSALESRVKSTLYGAMARPLAWPARTHVDEMVLAASPYLRDDLDGEAILTLGGPIHEHRAGLIDGVVSVGPLDCMPNKVAEALFFHVGEREKLLSLTIPLNGEPFDIALLDDFVFELRRRFDARGQLAVPASARSSHHASAT